MSEWETISSPDSEWETVPSAIIPKKRSTWDEIKRQTGLAARYATEGVLSLPAMVGNVPGAVVNTVLDASERLGAKFGSKSKIDYRVPEQSQALSNVLTQAGLPQPETSGERVVGDVSRAVSSAGTGIGLGNALANSAGPVAASIGNTLQANRAMQAASAAASATASGATREAGGEKVSQLVAGLGAGLAVPAVTSGTQWLYETAKNAVRPLTKGGQEQMASNLLANQATNPTQAARNLAAIEEVLPGSPRTMGEASQDPGIMAVEKGLRNKDAAAFAPTVSAQNTAQQKALSEIAGTPADIVTAENARDTATSAMREAALSNDVGRTIGAPIKIVTDKIDDILASPVGERQVVAKALSDFKGQLEGKTDPARLYEIRKDINDAMLGKLGGEKSVYALARKQLGDVKNTLDNAIEFAAPGFKAYLERYKDLSKPINQMEVLQEIQKRAQLTSMDALTREQFLGPANFSRAVDAALADESVRLTAAQVEALKAIRTDLQYGQALNSRLIKPAGSDTFQNLSIAQVLGAGESSVHPMMKLISRPLQWVYKLSGTDKSVNSILTAAALDPKLAAQLLSKATPKSVETFSQTLRMRAMAGSLGSAAQVSAMQSKWTEDTNSPQQDQGAAR